MANQAFNNHSGRVPYEKPAIIYKGVFENPLGSEIPPGNFDGVEFRTERDGGQNWLRGFVDLLRSR